MNVADTRFKCAVRTIAFTPGSIIPDRFGFTYRYSYVDRDGKEIDGYGAVENEGLGGMSPAEIELRCAVENPVTDADREAIAYLMRMTELPD